VDISAPEKVYSGDYLEMHEAGKVASGCEIFFIITEISFRTGLLAVVACKKKFAIFNWLKIAGCGMFLAEIECHAIV
jgi:hypothetical protein